MCPGRKRDHVHRPLRTLKVPMLLRFTFPCVGTQAVVQSFAQAHWLWSGLLMGTWPPLQVPGLRSEHQLRSGTWKMVMTCQTVSFTREKKSYGTYVRNTCIAMKNKNIYWGFWIVEGSAREKMIKCFFVTKAHTLPNPQTITAGEGVERGNPPILLVNVKQCSHYREHYGGPLKTKS